MAATTETGDMDTFADRLTSAITSYDVLGVDGDGKTHYLSVDRDRVAVIDGEPERSLVDEADDIQVIDGDVDGWIAFVDDRRGWTEFDATMVVALARERSGGD